MCIFCDNTSAINLSKNPVQHSKSKHIEIRYHFIRDLVEEKIMWLEFINIDNQKADIFTKPLDGLRFESLCKTTGFGVIPWLISLVWLIISSLQYRSHMCMFVSFTKFVFVLVFVDLTLHVLFLSVLKNSKIHKNWKILKNLIACVVYLTCEFGLVPPY